MTAAGALVAGRYRLRSQLGGGGMGAVWLARDELLGRKVAVKQVLVPVGIDAELAAANREAAMREGRIAARLSHPHAVSVYDMVLEAGQPWLVMEYLPSRSLAQLLHDQGVLPVPQVAQIGAQVADALTATHAAGVVHRDVKPGNILIGEGPGRDGLVKITDFGISRAQGDVSLTQTGVVKGTPAFLAPEVARGQSPDEASDVFSLGATLYTCLEGTPPFGLSDNALQMLHRVAGGEFTPPQHAGALTAPWMRMLAADPTDRPTMPQVRDQLAVLAAGPDRDVTEVLTARTPLPRTLTDVRAIRASDPPPTPAGRAAVETPPPLPPFPAAESPAESPAAELPPAKPAPAEPLDPDPSPAEPSRTEPAPPADRKRKRWVAVLAALLLLAAAAAVVLVLLNQRADPSADAQGTSSSSAPPSSSAPASSSAAQSSAAQSSAAQSSAADSTTPSAPSTTPPSSSAPESSVAGPPTAAGVRNAITSYYSLLPGDPESAWARTGPTLRAAENHDNYIRFWNRFDSVLLGPVAAQDGSLVATAPVTFVENGVTNAPEQHTITLIQGEDGGMVIDSDVPG